MFKRFPAHYLVTAILAIGLACLIVATIKLQSIFLTESDRNTDFLKQRRLGIENYASEELKDILSQEINNAISEISKIIDNPLLEKGNYFWRQRGEQRIPRPIFYTAQQDFSAQKYFLDLMQPSKKDQVDTNSSLQRQIEGLAKAIGEDDEPLVERIIREVISNDYQDNDDVAKAIVFRLAILSTFSDYNKASTSLISKLLRDNLFDEYGNNILGLQKQLLVHRNRFIESDFIYLRDKITQLSKNNLTPITDFTELSQRKFELPSLAGVTGNSIFIVDNIWLVENQGDNLFGVKFDLSKAVDKIKINMTLLGLIHEDDELLLKLGNNRSTAFEDISFDWRSENWRQALTDSNQFDAIKRVVLFSSLIVSIALILLVWWIYRHQSRWINNKSEFVATVSHEIRTPLSAIRLMAERLEEKLTGDEKAKDYPRRIIADIDALNFLTDNILSFERLNSGNWISHKSPITLRDMFFDLKKELPLFITQDFLLDIKGDDLTEIYADPMLIKLLFSNLIKNSCLYNDHQKPIITIDWNRNDAELVIDLVDNGKGFSKSERIECFKPFYRGKDQRHTRGSGLGLALCKKIIDLHNGHIEIFSSSSQGTHFKVICKCMNNDTKHRE